MAISRDKIEEIIQSADIVSIIGEYVALEKKGNDYKGLCPFHSDKNPSLSVSPKRKVYTCFSCHATGNVVTFVQNFSNISFIEALKKVANKSGIELDISENPKELKYAKYHKIMNDARDLYEFYLHNTKEGNEATEYLKKRQISDDVIRYFHIGLSSNEENIITKSLLGTNKYLPLELLDVGLIGSDDKNKRYFDLFKNRIMFPLEDLKGNVIGFSGRIYNSDSNSKYINSHENILFRKSNVLYNYAKAVNEIKIKDQVVVFEGFMDVIAAYRANVLHAVATMGTALTEDQVRILTTLTKNIILCYDGDEPGIVSTKRAIKLFMAANCNLSIVILPDGLDPDDYINKYGKEALEDLLLNKAVNPIDYLYEIEKRKLIISDPMSISNFQKSMKELIHQFNSKIFENFIINRMSEDLNITKDDIINELKNIPNVITDEYVSNNTEQSYEGYDIPPIDDIGYTDYPTIDVPVNNENQSKPSKRQTNLTRYEKAEEDIIYLCYYNKELCLTIKRKLGIDEFVDRINRNILLKLYDYYSLAEVMSPNDFANKLDELELGRLNSIVNNLDLIYNLPDDKNSRYMKDLLFNSVDTNIDVIKKAKYMKRLKELEEDNDNSLQRFEEKSRMKKNIIKISKKSDRK